MFLFFLDSSQLEKNQTPGPESEYHFALNHYVFLFFLHNFYDHHIRIQCAIWSSDIAHKLQHFLWWVSLHAITVKANLRRCRINIYVAQERKQGTVSFFFCPYTEVIWRISPIHPTHIICYPTITIGNIKSFFPSTTTPMPIWKAII